MEFKPTDDNFKVFGFEMSISFICLGKLYVTLFKTPGAIFRNIILCENEKQQVPCGSLLLPAFRRMREGNIFSWFVHWGGGRCTPWSLVPGPFQGYFRHNPQTGLGVLPRQERGYHAPFDRTGGVPHTEQGYALEWTGVPTKSVQEYRPPPPTA